MMSNQVIGITAEKLSMEKDYSETGGDFPVIDMSFVVIGSIDEAVEFYHELLRFARGYRHKDQSDSSGFKFIDAQPYCECEADEPIKPEVSK